MLYLVGKLLSQPTSTMYTHRRQTNTTTKMYKNTIYLSLIYKLIHILIYKANKIIRIKSDHNIITKYLSHCCYCMATDLTTPPFASFFFLFTRYKSGKRRREEIKLAQIEHLGLYIVKIKTNVK